MIRPICEGTELSIDQRTILPIGFLPSNILANWVLTPFDNAIITQLNPVYYGRYVDDMIIVDKVEKNDPLYKMAREKDGSKQLTADTVIRKLLIEKKQPIFQDDGIKESVSAKEADDKNFGEKKPNPDTYRIASDLFSSPNCRICVQNRKVKVFYFQSGATKALLHCFQTQIARNVSEFRLMPDMDRVLQQKDYGEIFNLKSSDSINKLRSVEGIDLNKFALSKFLGKYRKVCGLINDKDENIFERDLLVILDERILIDNYGSWERILEILVVNNRVRLLEQCSLRILSAIRRFEVPEDKVHPACIYVKDGLLKVFRAALCRVSALAWSIEIDNTIRKIYEEVQKYAEEAGCTADTLQLFEPEQMQRDRWNYCRFRMVNKYVLPIPIDCMLTKIEEDDHPNIRLCELAEDISGFDTAWEKVSYRYYPYMLTPQDISFALLCEGLCRGCIDNPKQQKSKLEEIYLSRNFPNVEGSEDRAVYELQEVDAKSFRTDAGDHYAVFVGKRDHSDRKGKLLVAIGNAELEIKNFKAALDQRPNRSYQRYRFLSKMLDAAVEQGVDLLVLPENYLPLEWLPTVARFCANNQLGLVTGIEHVLVKEGQSEKSAVYNLTAVILPYMHKEQRFAHVCYHSKVNFSPEEKCQIEGYHCICREGAESGNRTYQLFCWHGVWFPVYCCFELASIQDRAIFQSYADLIVAVEWNKDIPYFSSIIESMCRDLHCYCIQANSSGPGDSRVLQPTKSEVRDIIKTKGGTNPCILAADIDIDALRNFQSLQYTLQKDDARFKPTPPNFDLGVLERKRKGTLFEEIEEIHHRL